MRSDQSDHYIICYRGSDLDPDSLETWIRSPASEDPPKSTFLKVASNAVNY